MVREQKLCCTCLTTVVNKLTHSIEKDTRKVNVVLVVIEVLGSIRKNLSKCMEKIGIELELGEAQKTTLLGAAIIN